MRAITAGQLIVSDGTLGEGLRHFNPTYKIQVCSMSFLYVL
jgi:hypothetical protein